jgi:hypothetical protein
LLKTLGNLCSLRGLSICSVISFEPCIVLKKSLAEFTP